MIRTHDNLSLPTETADHVRDLPVLLTLDELARFLRCSKGHVSKLVRGSVRGVVRLPVVRLGRRVLVRREELFRWLAAQSSGSVSR